MADRPGNRDQQPVREARCERDHFLQPLDLVAATAQVSDKREQEGIGTCHVSVAGGMAPLHLNGRDVFRDAGQAIDLNNVIQCVKPE